MKLKNKKSIIFKMLVFIGIVISCHSNSQNMQEYNKEVEKFSTKELYPSQKSAYEKNGDMVLFYLPGRLHERYAKVDLKSHVFDIKHSMFLNTDDLLEINHFKYFLPKKYSTFYKYPIGRSGTAGGDFFTLIEFNELGLVKSIEKNLPDAKNKYLYHYNKYGQLLRIAEDKMIDKILLENIYDENGRLISQKKNTRDIQSVREFSYDKNDNILVENIKEKVIAPNGKVVKDETYTLRYQYDSKGKIVRKYSENENHVVEFQYDPASDTLMNIVEYYGISDKGDAKKWVNHFTKTTYTYTKDQITGENKYEYNIVNASVLADKKWTPISVEQQKALAWKKFKEGSETPLSEIDKKYQYETGAIHTEINTYNFSNKFKNGKTEVNKELADSEKIKFILDNNGRITQKEISNTKKNSSEVQVFYY
ncbi:conserved exported protein of unknown function [Chryseobacterium sp. JV274]|nr:conserved exported protein of unknown function [Chryseobacterium sp. JV274]